MVNRTTLINNFKFCFEGGILKPGIFPLCPIFKMSNHSIIVLVNMQTILLYIELNMVW